MEIFKLLGTIAVSNDEANQNIEETTGKASTLGSKLKSGITTAAKWGTAIVAGASAAATGLVSLATSAASTADRIDKMSQKIGISREAFQELDFICSQSGTSVDTLQQGIKTLTNQMSSAADGTASAKDMFDKLGVSIYDTNGNLKDQETMMWEAMSALQSMENQTEKAALANDLFGRSGTELMPLLNGEAGSIEEMREQAHELGLVLNDELVDSGVSLTDTIDQMKRSLSAVVTNLGGALMPLVENVCNFIIANLPTIQGIFESMTPVLVTLLSTLLPPMMSLVESILPLVVNLVNQILPMITAVADNILPLIIGLLQWLLPLLTSLIEYAMPYVISGIEWLSNAVTIAVDGIGTAFDNLVGWLSDAWTSIKETATAVWNGIWAAIKGVINSILGGVENMVNGVINGINTILSGINAVASAVGSALGLDWSVGTLPGVSLPRLEKGGVLEKGQVGLLEGSGAEAVVPLENNSKWISAVASDMDRAAGVDDEKLQRIIDLLETLIAMFPETMTEAFAAMKFEIANREFARLVKAVN